VLLCSKTLSKRIIYALFAQHVVGFWGLHPRPRPGLHPWTPLGDSTICPPLEKILRALVEAAASAAAAAAAAVVVVVVVVTAKKVAIAMHCNLRPP